MILDRTKAPKVNEIKEVELLKATTEQLDNGIPLNVINAGTQELIKLEFLFDAGYVYQQHPLVASTVNDLIDAGTPSMSAKEIAEKIDYYGAFIETDINADYASVSIYTLNKHLTNLLPIIEDVLKSAIFPENELSINISNRLQRFLVDEQKVNTLARRKFLNLLYGESNCYGYYIQKSDFEKVNVKLITNFYNKHYTPKNCRIIVSGKVSDSVKMQINKHFGGNDWTGSSSSDKQDIRISNATKTGETIVLKEDALQSAIRVGRVLFNKTHVDFLPMQVLNTVLGGYFGSRLMSNIREDKGYTYGIGSGIMSQKYSGYFFISTEVGVEVCAKAIDEIFLEIKRLREELIPVSELNLVRNYMLGSFLSSIDGPFALADRFKGIVQYGLGYDYYDRYLQAIRTITPEMLRDLANKYLNQEDLITLVVGKK